MGLVGVGLGLVAVGDVADWEGAGDVADWDGAGEVADWEGAGDVAVCVGVGGVPLGAGVVGVALGVVGVALGVVGVALGVVGVADGVVGVALGVVGVADGVVGVALGVVGVADGVVGVALGVVGVALGVVGVADGVVGVADGVVGVGVGVGVGQFDAVIVSSSRVTAPLRASTRPAMVSPVSTEIDVRARTVPVKSEFVPRVAELPTCQNTLQAWAPLVRMTLLAESVTSVEGTWKMKTAFGSPPASRVSDPPTSSEEDALYTPGASVWPAPMKAGTLAVWARPAASLYAVVRSDWACAATASALCMVPLITWPGGNPVTAAAGLTPRSPLMMLRPVLVTWGVPARTAKLAAVPSPTGAVAATAGWAAMNMAMAPAAATGPAASQA